MIAPRETAVGAEGVGYQMRVGESTVALAIADQVEAERLESHLSPAGTQAGPSQPETASPPASSSAPASSAAAGIAGPEPAPPESTTDASASSGIDLLRGVELEASLRFGSREMALSELLALGPGDVIQLDRALADPVDLVVGDKIVACGEVVLVNGNFGLRVTQVAEPHKSLESVRCLF